MSFLEGALLEVDESIKEFLVREDRKASVKFIRAELDDTHLFVDEDSVDYIRELVKRLYDDIEHRVMVRKERVITQASEKAPSTK